MTTDPRSGGTRLTSGGQADAPDVANGFLLRLSVLATKRVESRAETAPPGSPSEGDAYIPAATATGAWTGEENNVVYWDTADWQSITPLDGMLMYDANTQILCEWRSGTWYARDGFQVLVDAATIAWDASQGMIGQVVLGGNRTMGAPTNVLTGRKLVLQVYQDGTGGRTLSWNSAYKWAGGSAPTITATANAYDQFEFANIAGELHEISRQQNLS